MENMADTIARIITKDLERLQTIQTIEKPKVFTSVEPLIESWYIESQKVWENLCKENKVYNSKDEFLDDDGFTKEEEEKIVKSIMEFLERGDN